MRPSAAYKVDVSGSVELSAPQRSLLRRVIRETLAGSRVPAASIGLCLLSDREMASLNKARLGHQGPTDVLTFDLSERAGKLEGEIAVSVHTARRQARRLGHRLEAELALYCVHAVLHLLGYDDGTRASAAAMHATEDQILESLGVGAVFAGARGASGDERARSADRSRKSRRLH